MGIKHKVNENFFKEWSSDMSYLLGYLYADGSMIESKEIRAKYLCIGSIDRYLVENSKKLLSSEHNLKIVERGGNRKRWYSLKIGSHKIYNDLEKLGVYQNKSNTISFPGTIPNKFINDFIRGYLDGDGCIHLEKGIGQRNQPLIKALKIIFTSGSKEFLSGMALVLNNKVGLKQTKVYDSRRSFQLRYGTHDSLELFKYMYKGKPRNFLNRKFDKFLAYFDIRPNRIDSSIRKIIKAQW
jgi:intein/homing endonuclease